MATAAEFRSLAEVFEDHTKAAIRATNGDLSEAAKLLGISRSTIYRRYPVNEVVKEARKKGSVRRVEELEGRRKKLREITEAAADEGQDDIYQLGVANGLLLARHIMDGRPGTPSYL